MKALYPLGEIEIKNQTKKARGSRLPRATGKAAMNTFQNNAKQSKVTVLPGNLLGVPRDDIWTGKQPRFGKANDICIGSKEEEKFGCQDREEERLKQEWRNQQRHQKAEVHDWQSGVGYEQVWKDVKWEREAGAMWQLWLVLCINLARLC